MTRSRQHIAALAEARGLCFQHTPPWTLLSPLGDSPSTPSFALNQQARFLLAANGLYIHEEGR